MTIWITGRGGAGTVELAREVRRQLFDAGVMAAVVDRDVLRCGLSADPDTEDVRRAGEVACLFAGAGVVAVVAVGSPRRAEREVVRVRHQAAGVPFVEVFVDNAKGLQREAEDGYEPPVQADVVITSGEVGVAAGVVLARVLADLGR
ncbi:adenylyl-sulfate kinase [Actinokineospora inagensis]|uniref:adenylyl-sulfate kinase n=1 Tax=Actinokineospora inagensis TaxID=103730 RepID=UPI0003F80F77|nr:adenylyl-sulfate kinase [Actinokineospora inagensis]